MNIRMFFKVITESHRQIIYVKFIHEYSKFKFIHICNGEKIVFLQKEVQHDF